jgi:(2Fe-2S) ferredoxin
LGARLQKKEDKFLGHLFICTNKKEKGDCCFPKGGEKIQKEIKEWIKADPKLNGKIKVSKSGCLSHCEAGITCVLYPSQQWFTHVTEADTEELKKLLLQCVK